MKKKRALFLCTGNSCRSQMAEGMVNYFLGDSWTADSAGTEPAGYVHPLAVRAMLELGINIADSHSKHVDAFRSVSFDAVITVCDDAAENCPVWLGSGQKKHLSFPDPAKATGTEEEKMVAFRQVRDGLRHQVLDYLSSLG